MQANSQVPSRVKIEAAQDQSFAIVRAAWLKSPVWVIEACNALILFNFVEKFIVLLAPAICD